ncbi:MAG: hypothetical protein SNJ59_12230 [Aggregatilineales bacterium]
MMLKWIVISVAILISACQPIHQTTPTAPADSTAEAAVGTTTGETNNLWTETEMDGVRLGMPMPHGWTAETRDGLILVEHMSSIATEEPASGILVYIFVPQLDHFNLPDPEVDNAALAVLRQVVNMPHEIGHNAVASEPVPFVWSDHQAAYYLLSNHDGIKTIVIAVELPEVRKLVVCNISLPSNQIDRVRALLPTVLDGLTLNGLRLSGDDLNVLPDPLIFPLS